MPKITIIFNQIAKINRDLVEYVKIKYYLCSTFIK